MADKDGKPGANGGADDDDEAGKTGNADPNKDAGKGNGKGGEGDGEKAEPKLQLTQKELDEMIAKRLNRAKKDADEKAQLSKEQLLEKERDDARKDLRIRDARDEFITSSGIEYAKASRLFKMYESDLEFDDKGKPENMKDVLKSAKADWPEMFKGGKLEGKGDGAGGNGGKSGGEPGQDMNSILRRATGRT